MNAPAFPPGRYGRRRSASRTRSWVVPALTCLIIAAMLALALGAYRRQNDQAQASVRNYVVTPRSVTITIEVTKPHRQPATCVLRARDGQGAVVGQASAHVPSEPGHVTLTQTVPTRARAVSGEVLRCSVGTK